MFKFNIIDYTTNPLGDTTMIDEPVGFDAVDLAFKRDEQWHSIFEFFDDTIKGLKFYDNAMGILKNAYDTTGIDANVLLEISYRCDEISEFLPLYTGSFFFSSYKEICGIECYVEIGVQSTSCLMKWRNKFDQKVDLENRFIPIKDCIEQSFTERTVFVANDIFILRGKYDKLISVGDTITISGTASNNGIFTVQAISYYLAPGDIPSTAVTVNELTIVSEFDVMATFDGCFYAKILPAYDALGTDIILNATTLVFNNEATMKDPYRLLYTDDILNTSLISTAASYYFSFNFENVAFAEMDDFTASNFFYGAIGADNQLFAQSKMVALFEQKPKPKLRCTSTVQVDTRLKGNFYFQTNDTVNGNGAIDMFVIDLNDTILQQITLVDDLDLFGSSDAIPFDVTDSRTLFLNDGDRVYIVYRISSLQYLSGNPTTGTPSDPFEVNLSFDIGSFKMQALSYCESTVAKGYLVNEVLSRITEYNTADCMRVYSEYFGRENAQPYPSLADGCAGLEAITSGLLVRQARQFDGTENTLIASLKEIYDNLSAIHNLGMGIETDPNRPGYNLVRVEPYKYFYNDSVVLECDYPTSVQVAVQEGKYVTTFKSGYSKYESEEVNGLYEIHGRREYRTDIEDASNELNKESTFIASGNTIEVTRRKFGTTSKDWRYDNDKFIICTVKRTGGVFSVEGEFVAPSAIVVTGDYSYLIAGDTIQVSGSTSNDGIYTILSSVLALGSTAIAVQEPIVTEPVGTFTITLMLIGYENETFPLTDGVDSFNIYEPFTQYNLRITPARNSMRWLSRIQQNNKTALSNLIFTDATGNKVAEVDLTAYATCPGEAQSIKENTDISQALFSDATDAQAKYTNELISFEYPVSETQLQAIIANPYGKVGFKCGSMTDYQYGWIVNFKRKFADGMAQITLKPEYIQL